VQAWNILGEAVVNAPVSISALARPWRARQQLGRHGDLLERTAVTVVALLCIATVIIFLWEPLDPVAGIQPSGQERLPLRVCATLAGAAALLWGVHCFTGDPYERRTYQVSFTYFVMAASFLVFALPLAVRNQAVGTEPIGILSGCVLGDGGEQLLSCRHAAKTDCDAIVDVPGALRCERARTNTNFHWVLNVGGTVAALPDAISEACRNGAKKPQCKLGSPDVRVVITGGMVVPLPFLFIALVGGAISMSRRVPEIQKRSEAEYLGTLTEPKLLPCEVRERLAFQILQFVSAPLLAIVAYQAIRPENPSTAAVLAFMSGFGSEYVLALIRGLFDGIRPAPPPSALAIATLTGVVTRGAVPVAGAKVGLPNATVGVTTGSDGRYVLAGVPLGAGQVTASHGELSRTAAFNLPAGGAVCDIDLEAATPPLPYPVRLKIVLDAKDVDPGSLRLTADEIDVPVSAEGFAEAQLASGVTHRLVARARRGNRTVEANYAIAPSAIDEDSVINITL
jgi:hypothetical protein